MILENARYKVLLPKWVLINKEKGENELFSAAQQYMERYKNYTFLCVDGDFAICQRKQ